MHPKSEDFREFSIFVESLRGVSRRLLERLGRLYQAPRMSGRFVDVSETGLDLREKSQKGRDFGSR